MISTQNSETTSALGLARHPATQTTESIPYCAEAPGTLETRLLAQVATPVSCTWASLVLPAIITSMD